MSIRTTVTLDEDVLEAVKREGHRKGMPFRRALNELVRAGLMAGQQLPASREFQIRPRDMVARAGLNFHNIGELLGAGEGEDYR